MIGLVQPFGLSWPGGGPKILRTLAAGAPRPVLSVCTAAGHGPAASGVPEIRVPSRPHLGRLDQGGTARLLGAVDVALSAPFRRRLRAALDARGVGAVHGLSHGADFWPLWRIAQRTGRPFFLSVHDDLGYALRGHPERQWLLRRLGQVWRGADARFVITDAMGEEYSRRYGQRPYVVVTDGASTIAATPHLPPAGGLRVYFMGLFHHGYGPVATAFARALDRRADGSTFVLRSGHANGLVRGSTPVQVLPFGSDEDVQADISVADVLYLPLQFGDEYRDFTRLSLSTKMITYLASGVPIVYHGPADSAAARLLVEHDAAVLLTSMSPDEIAAQLDAERDRLGEVAANGLRLAAARFRVEDVQNRFWSATGAVVG